MSKKYILFEGKTVRCPICHSITVECKGCMSDRYTYQCLKDETLIIVFKNRVVIKEP